ncbi:MAG: hypothetical protein HHJ16_14960 [Polaromonas sp.]|uniref:hypothetical protein n=1 Tax=Polaromonas sp. TaxID=1869339 RepID=UPI0017CE20DB|nr:hypothetical protein [Polaromonas sp.]NMM11558.1 hypothetical protein [Polaromonas sp.]
MKLLNIFGLACAALVIALPAQVTAQTSPVPPSAVAANSHGDWFDKPVETASLDGYRGGSDLVQNDMQLTGTTANNTAVNLATGNNSISAGAFSNMSGIPLVIQNSGANVLIQNAVILHLQMN